MPRTARSVAPFLALAMLAGCRGATPSSVPESPSTSASRPATPSPSPTVTSPASPTFQGTVSEIDAATRARMTHSWRPGCPVGLEDLRLLALDHWGFDGSGRRGELVVHADVAEDVLGVFHALFDARVPIERLRLVDVYGGDDVRSMEANNTSGFNCRETTGGGAWSEHAYGRAIDLNPVQNPYVDGDEVLPEAGRAYVDRADVRRGMIVAGDAVVRAFAAIGWSWGGDYRSLKDYQHFSATGR